MRKRQFAKLQLRKKNTLMTKIDFTNIDLSQQNRKVKVNEKFHAFLEILENVNMMKKTSRHVSHIYKNWKHLFEEKTIATTLFKHQSWNHKIKLKSKKQLTFEFIYFFFEKKSIYFRQYLNENEKKKIIKKFESSTKYSILFVSKKMNHFVTIQEF